MAKSKAEVIKAGKARKESGSLRLTDAMVEGNWGKPQTPDSGIGSRAKGAISELPDTDVDGFRKLYSVIIKTIGKADEAVQRAALLAAASDYTLDSLIKKAASKPTVVFKTIDDEVRERMEAMPDAGKLSMSEIFDRFAKVKEAVQAERAAKRQAKAE